MTAIILKDGGDEELESYVVGFLTSDGGWWDATRIGLKVGFDKREAARRVRGVLKRLVAQGVVESDSAERPIIYRLKDKP
jgi:DNA-binding transcriptional regulator PaaX